MVMLRLSDVKARLSEIAEEVDRTHERVHITRNGREYVVLIAAEDLEAIEATLELRADAAAQQRITQSQRGIARREGMTLDPVEQALRASFGERSHVACRARTSRTAASPLHERVRTAF